MQLKIQDYGRVTPQQQIFLCQIVATWKIACIHKYIHLKACHMYLQILLSDVSIRTGVQSCSEMVVSKVEHHLHVKITVNHCRNAWKCHSDLCEALGNRALPYQTVVRWVKTFKSGRVSTANMHHSDVLCPFTQTCQWPTDQWMDEDEHWTMMGSAECTGIPGSAVLQILRLDLKIAAKWVPHYLNEMQHWIRYDTCHVNLEWFHCKGNNTLNGIIVIDETWARAYKLELKWQSSEWCHYHKNARFLKICMPQ